MKCNNNERFTIDEPKKEKKNENKSTLQAANANGQAKECSSKNQIKASIEE